MNAIKSKMSIGFLVKIKLVFISKNIIWKLHDKNIKVHTIGHAMDKKIKINPNNIFKKKYLATKHSESALLMCFIKHLLKTKFQRNGTFWNFLSKWI